MLLLSVGEIPNPDIPNVPIAPSWNYGEVFTNALGLSGLIVIGITLVLAVLIATPFFVGWMRHRPA